jgi:hypothetical protein
MKDFRAYKPRNRTMWAEFVRGRWNVFLQFGGFAH